LKNDVQVIVSVLAFDGQNDADIPGLIAASCALHISDIPWNGPIAAARLNRLADGTTILNGRYEERLGARFDLDVAGTKDKVIMLEAGCDEAEDEIVRAAIHQGQKDLQPAIELIEKVRTAVGKPKAQLFSPPSAEDEARTNKLRAIALPLIDKLFFAAPKATKLERAQAKSALKKALAAELETQGTSPEDIKLMQAGLGAVLDEAITRNILDHQKRVDGRGLDDIRALTSDVGILPCVHGSGLFERGETQVLTVCTLGAPGDKQTLDGMELVGEKRYMHHYNFPPFSVGEAKPLRGAGRREIGHGALAEKALQYMIPEASEFPYTIRVVSEVLQSNGSSSMGSTCGSTLALMDAGVPIKAPVAGLAMGLASDGQRYQVITDLQDLEDGEGGMDFKVAGTRTGITAIQLDTKTDGLPEAVIDEALARARTGRLRILDVMSAAIAAPRAELSPNAPRIISLQINPEKIREVIGSGGKTINEIILKTGVTTIDIEQTGLVMITSKNGESAEAARKWVEELTAEAEVGKIYHGTVVRLMDFGAFVEIMPGKDGLVHVSEMAPWRVGKVGDLLKIGDKVYVKALEIDEKGRLNLSMKQAEGNVYTEDMKNRSMDRSAAPLGKKPASKGPASHAK
jgi:polyribonucleotide nucleotidyltransferase